MNCAYCGTPGTRLCPACERKAMAADNWSKPTIPGPCFNRECPNHCDNDSGCRIHTVWAADLCDSYRRGK